MRHTIANNLRQLTLRGVALAAALLLTAVFPLRCDAQSSRVRINVVGLGAERCDAIRSGRLNKEDVTIWVEGFWTGLNSVAAASDQQQSLADTDLMMAEVEKLCDRKPSQILAAVAWNAFLSLNQSSR
jgi:hypothetical protein